MASASDAELEPIQDYIAHSSAAARDGDVERLNAVLNLWECRITPQKITREEFREVLHEVIRENQPAAVSCLLSRLQDTPTTSNVIIGLTLIVLRRDGHLVKVWHVNHLWAKHPHDRWWDTALRTKGDD